MKGIFVAVIVLGVTGVACADSLRASILNMDKMVAKALKKKDMVAFDKAVKPGITSDFKYIERGKSMSYDMMLTQMKGGVGSLQKVTVSGSKLLSLKEMGSTGVAVERNSMGGTMMTPDKKVHNLLFVGISTEKFKKINGKWMMTEMSWKDDKNLMDGKPFDPSAMGGQ